jgi:hypothetical protein
MVVRRSEREEKTVTVQQMLEAHPGAATLDRAALAACVEACAACVADCTMCADADLAEPEVDEMRRCIRRCLDCADACVATGRMAARQTERDAGVLRAMVEACRAACRACAEECERHAGHHEHCRICAGTCRTCEAACDALLGALG